VLGYRDVTQECSVNCRSIKLAKPRKQVPKPQSSLANVPDGVHLPVAPADRDELAFAPPPPRPRGMRDFFSPAGGPEEVPPEPVDQVVPDPIEQVEQFSAGQQALLEQTHAAMVHFLATKFKRELLKNHEEFIPGDGYCGPAALAFAEFGGSRTEWMRDRWTIISQKRTDVLRLALLLFVGSVDCCSMYSICSLFSLCSLCSLC
jgi:hypothetical protein